MRRYARPDIHHQAFFDVSGNTINYGERWGEDSPPGDSYSVTSNLERFAPLHEVADCVIAYLEEAYDVVVESDPVGSDAGTAEGQAPARKDVVRVVRVVPNAPDAAALTFVFTSFPSVIVRAGELQEFLYPICGCDACDETWDRTAEELEWQVFAVAAGGLEERINTGADLEVFMSLAAEDGSRMVSGQSARADFAANRVAEAERRLVALAGAWERWPVR
jgi:hypothetical protein